MEQVFTIKGGFMFGPENEPKTKRDLPEAEEQPDGTINIEYPDEGGDQVDIEEEKPAA